MQAYLSVFCFTFYEKHKLAEKSPKTAQKTKSYCYGCLLKLNFIWFCFNFQKKHLLII
jgi:hypothetical protein